MVLVYPNDIERLKKIRDGVIVVSSGNTKRAKDKLAIFERDDYTCVECKSKEQLTIDHIGLVPRERTPNGWKKNDWSLNKCRTLCAKCHIQKNIRTKLLFKRLQIAKETNKEPLVK